VIAFFWSPDSEKLALVTFAAVPSAFNISTSAQPERLSLTWWVMDVASGSITRYASFVPTDSMIYILGFFDQFSQSHRLWSPDSTHLVYAEIQEDGTRSINLLDTRRTDAVPFSVANGEIGIWSYR
jgi:TolB protein